MPIHFQGTLPHASVAWNSPEHKTALREVREEVGAFKDEGVPHAAVYSCKEGNTVHIGVATDEDAQPYDAFKRLTETLPGVTAALQRLQKSAQEQGASPSTVAPTALKSVPVKVRQALFSFYEALNRATHDKAKGAAHSYDRLPIELHDLSDALRSNYDHAAYKEVVENLHDLEAAVQTASREQQPAPGLNHLA